MRAQVDNLNAAIDLRILYHVVTKNINFAMEVTTRTRQDVQGGTLVGYEGKYRLLEASQVLDEHLDAFKSLKNFPLWVTNNLWVSLKEIKAALAAGTIQPPVIVTERVIRGGSDDAGGGERGGTGSSAAAGGGGGGAPRPTKPGPPWARRRGARASPFLSWRRLPVRPLSFFPMPWASTCPACAFCP